MMESHGTRHIKHLEQQLIRLERDVCAAGFSADTFQPLRRELEEMQAHCDRDARSIRRFKLMAEALNDWVWEVDADGVYTFVSRKVRDVLGYDPAEMLGRTPFDFMPPEEAERVRVLFGEFFAQQKPFRDLENINRHKEGHLATMATSATPVFDDEGNFAGYVGADRNISELQCLSTTLDKTLEDKAELARRMNLAVDAAGIGIWDLDLQKNQLVWDEWMYRLYGVDSQEFSGAYDAWQKGLHPDDRQVAVTAVEEAIAGVRPFDTDFRVVTPSGEVRHLKAFARISHDGSGKAVRMTGVNYDITAQKNAELELNRQSERLEKIYNGITDAILIADSETRTIVHCNHVAELLLERECSALCSMRFDSIHPEDLLPELIPAFQRQSDGAQRVVETEVLTASGKRIPVSILASKVEYAGRPALMGVFRDISESKEAERLMALANRQLAAMNQQLQASEQQLMAANQQLQASEQQLMAANQQLMATETDLRSKNELQSLLAGVSMLLMNPDSVQLDAVIEEALSRIGGFAGADRCYVFLISDDGEVVSNTHEWCAGGIESQKDNLQGIASDAVPWWMERHRQMQPVFIPLVSRLPEEANAERELLERQNIKSLLALPMSDGTGLKGFLGLDWVRGKVSTIRAIDIPLLQLGGDLIFSALRRNVLSKELLGREMRYRAMYESVQDVYVIVDLASGLIEEVSPSIRQFGYESGEVRNVPLESLYPYPEELQQLHRELLEKDSLRDYEIHFRRKDGSIATVSLAISLQEFPGGGLKAVSSLRDITLRKEHEIQIRENLRLKNDFISSVSHELRTPLFSILGFSSTLLKQSEVLDLETRNEFVSIIHDESVRLSALIEDLLTISRIESGKKKYKPQRLNPAIVFSGVVDVLGRQAVEKRIELVESYPADQLFIEFDRDSLKQVLMNLLGNAIKFTPEGGRVEARIMADGSEARIEVEDNGIGIDDSEHEKIFEKFYRVEHDSIIVEGTGLGLAIVRQIVEVQQGRIEVSSQVGRGSTFVLRVPLAADGRVREA
ncbi:PAS domain S-box protein [Chlorobium sp. N1]|uniref:PAS domain S-box protein n=1 Tax=Chlorobium sp. N1 TaxID=2491138 RepID=UPI001040B956|nr:PAS domain S-box protein [Chlorobium sp. N1]TCD48537.1 PAS domain S-box protein [Chlorobium sp. N1]